MASLLKKDKARALLVFCWGYDRKQMPLFKQVGFSVLFELSKEDLEIYLNFCKCAPFVNLFAETKLDLDEGEERESGKNVVDLAMTG